MAEENATSNQSLENIEDNASSSPRTRTIRVKTANGAIHNVTIQSKWKVCDLKQALESVVNIPQNEQRLVYGGRVLVNDKSLDEYEITDSYLHVLRNVSPPSLSAAPTATNLNSIGSYVEQSSNPFLRNQNNGDFMQQMLNNPMMQQLLDSPDILRMVMESSPEMQRLREENPDLNHMLNDPDVLRQSVEMMRNPSLLREMMRNTDRAMGNIESIPGGFNALTRLYHTIQEPMHSATMEAAANTRATQHDNYSCNISDNESLKVTAMPNPWAPASSTPSRRPAAQARRMPFMGQPNAAVANPLLSNDSTRQNQQNPRQNAIPDLSQLLLSSFGSDASRNSFSSEMDEVQNRLASLGLVPPNTGTANNNTNTNTNSATAFAPQLEALQAMGFSDRAACIRALEQAGGNLSRAIHILLQEPS